MHLSILKGQGKDYIVAIQYKSHTKYMVLTKENLCGREIGNPTTLRQ